MSLEGNPQILVLGVGNILFKDEGIGVRAVSELQQQGGLPSNVTLLDGGTAGLRLMDAMMACDYLIVVDAVLGGGQPGTIYRLEGEGLRKSLGFHDSLHQLDLVDTLLLCAEIDKAPKTVVIGMEPADFQTMEIGLTESCEKAIPRLCQKVLEEIQAE